MEQRFLASGTTMTVLYSLDEGGESLRRLEIFCVVAVLRRV